MENFETAYASPLILYMQSLGFELVFLLGDFSIQYGFESESLTVYFRARGETASIDIYNEPFWGDYDNLPDCDPIYKDAVKGWSALLDQSEVEQAFLALFRDAKDKIYV
jgi:hypothetical protein